ncbi:hypothetical protein HYV10_03930, partial [Candidatus Dependentiae bacterium]|nr:hypothetical protein [Candidatus Dependentiae bacterium]
MNFFVKSYFLIALSCFGLELYGKKYHAKCQMYTDPFGPLKTGYTMGDLVRYSVHPLNIYYGIVTPPLGAQDIKNYGDNPANLYNALGYLYAGWAALHNNAVNFSTWVGSYRQPGGNPFQSNPQKALLEFDNNQYGQHNISYPMTFPAGWSTGIGYFTPQGGDYNNAFTGFSAHVVDEQPATMTNANASFGWCPNVNDGNYVLYFGDNPTVDYDNLSISSAYVYPIGQFCGARIAHILGAVVNDIPWSDDNAQSGASGGTTAFESPLISGVNGNGTALPMIAVMSGNAAGWAVSGSGATATSTPVGMFQPSTAHFGSMQTFLSKLSKPLGNNVGYNYLINHFSPAVSRLSSLCSYKISQDATALNLIEIEDSKVTAYDNGLVIAIQNNTGDQLQINQVGSSASNQIGALDEGGNNYYLHTASLMKGQTAPDQTQMISITDSSSDVVGGTYIQVLSSVQLQQLVDAVNSTSEQIIIDGQALPGLNYNQIMSGYTVPTDITPAYVVVTNFNPMLDSNNKLSSLNLPADSASRANILNSYRIQAINVAEFLLKPYFLTLQINKENIGYGVQTNYKKDASGNYVSNADGNYEIAGYSLSSGAPNNYILYACMSTVNIFTWQNYLHTIKNKRYPQPRHYSHIPLMMVPDTVMDYDLLGIKNYSGLKAYYLIWLIAYSAAMTEVAADWSKGILPLINTVFNLPQNFYNKVIIDQNGQLQSGKTLNLGNEFLGNNIMTLCACDTWDSGGGFNQDIPILNLYTDSQGNIVPNKSGSDYINLVLTFEPEYNFSLQQKLMNNYFAYR